MNDIDITKLVAPSDVIRLYMYMHADRCLVYCFKCMIGTKIETLWRMLATGSGGPAACGFQFVRFQSRGRCSRRIADSDSDDVSFIHFDNTQPILQLAMVATVLVAGLLLAVAVAPVAAAIATIYLEANYSGLSLDMDVFSGNTSLPWTLGIASLRLSPGYELVGYDAPAFQGYYMVWDADAPSLGSLWSSRIMSFKVRSATNDLVLSPNNLQNVVNVYQAGNFSGQKRSLHLGKDTFNSPLARAVMSIKVTPGYLFVAYDGPDQSGKSTSFAADAGNLAAWDARILSYDLRRVSNATVTPATLVPPPSPSTTPNPTSTDDATNCTSMFDVHCLSITVVDDDA